MSVKFTKKGIAIKKGTTPPSWEDTDQQYQEYVGHQLLKARLEHLKILEEIAGVLPVFEERHLLNMEAHQAAMIYLNLPDPGPLFPSYQRNFITMNTTVMDPAISCAGVMPNVRELLEWFDFPETTREGVCYHLLTAGRALYPFGYDSGRSGFTLLQERVGHCVAAGLAACEKLGFDGTRTPRKSVVEQLVQATALLAGDIE